MTQYKGLMADETGCQFTVDVEGADIDEAWLKLQRNYPESSVLQVATPEALASQEVFTYQEAYYELY